MKGRLQRRIRYWLESSERARLLQEEMDAHLEMMTQEMVEGGMKEQEARKEARRQFGNLTQQQEEARGAWIARWFSDLVQDTAYAARTIRQRPGFATLAVLSTALGIGACSLIFGIANFALFRPLPVEDPNQLVSISGKNVRRGRSGQSMAYPDFADLRQARSFQGMTAFFSFMPGTISSNGEPQRYWGSVATANYFDVARPRFVLGRGFDAARDDRKGESPVVVLSHPLWTSRFGSDPNIVGKSIELNRRQVTVVGVAGPAFRGTESMFYSDFWVPFSMLDSLTEAGMGGERLQNRSNQWLMAAGRLRDGVTEREAAAEIDVIAERLTASYPATNKDRSFHVERAGQVNPGARKMIVVLFLMLLSVAVLVLCTACANVANLLLARASTRQKEIATRLAIGAGRGRLIRQLLTESVMLALLGGIGGYVIAELGVSRLGASQMPLALPVDFSIALDYRVMLFCIGLSTITGVIFGLVPALRATRPDLTGALKDERVTMGKSRRFGLRNILVVAQVSICMVLLIVPDFSCGVCRRLMTSSLDSRTAMYCWHLSIPA
jgi:predicted permease